MKSKKLIKLGQRKRLKAELGWLDAQKAKLEQVIDTSAVQLLEMPFAEWCESLKIKSPTGLVPFELFDWQRETAKLITGEAKATGRQIVVLSSRQTGKTSLFLALSGYLAQAISHFTGVIIHKTGTDAGLLARRLKRFLGGVKPDPDNLSLLGFSSGAFLHFRSSNPSRGVEGAEATGRGLESVDLTIIEESGHTSNLADVLGVIGPALTWGNPKLSILIGTAGSKASHYYHLLAEAAGGAERLEALLEGIRQGTEQPFQILNREGPGPIAVISNWRCIPEFAKEPDFLGRVQQELNLSDSQIASEYEMKFSAAVDSAVFGFESIMGAQIEAIGPFDPDDAVIYVGVDPAGQGKDYSVAIALEVERSTTGKDLYSVCQIYRRRTGSAELHLNAIVQMAEELNPIAMCVESNSMGSVWIEHLSKHAHSCDVTGFATSKPSKESLIARLQIALERGVLQIPKGPIIDELLNFRRNDNGQLQAAGSGHDDCVMALGLALFAAQFNQ